MSKRPHEMGKAKKHLFLESLGQVAESMSALKGVIVQWGKGTLGAACDEPQHRKVLLQSGGDASEQETSQSHWSLQDVHKEARGPGRGDSRHNNSRREVRELIHRLVCWSDGWKQERDKKMMLERYVLYTEN